MAKSMGKAQVGRLEVETNVRESDVLGECRQNTGIEAKSLGIVLSWCL